MEAIVRSDDRCHRKRAAQRRAGQSAPSRLRQSPRSGCCFGGGGGVARTGGVRTPLGGAASRLPPESPRTRRALAGTKAGAADFEYIEDWCNARRRRSTLGYLSPASSKPGARRPSSRAQPVTPRPATVNPPRAIFLRMFSRFQRAVLRPRRTAIQRRRHRTALPTRSPSANRLTQTSTAQGKTCRPDPGRSTVPGRVLLSPGWPRLVGNVNVHCDEVAIVPPGARSTPRGTIASAAPLSSRNRLPSSHLLSPLPATFSPPPCHAGGHPSRRPCVEVPLFEMNAAVAPRDPSLVGCLREGRPGQGKIGRRHSAGFDS